MKKALPVVSIAIVVIGILIAVYFLFFSGSAGVTVDNGIPTNNPFGAPGGATQNTGAADTGAQSEAPDTATRVAPRLVKITSRPVAFGAIALTATTTPVANLASSTEPTPTVEPFYSLLVRYIDRESGNMYEYAGSEGKVTRITNRTVPGVHEVSWLPDGSRAFVRFVATDTDGSEHIETYALPADGSDGAFLARDLAAVIPERGGSVFTFLPSSSGSVGMVGRPDGSGQITLFTSALSALTFSSSSSDLVATTKPSAALPGYAFLVDGTAGTFIRELGPLPGLATLFAPTGDRILYSAVVNGSLALAAYDLKTHATLSLPVQTLAEKCVWTADGTAAYCGVPTSFPGLTLPDSWYQGTVSFTDRLWKIDFSTRTATLLLDLTKETSESIDAVSLTLDPRGSTLVFTNRRDGSLWAYSL